MNGWRRTGIISTAVVALGALTLGAGTVFGGGLLAGRDRVVTAGLDSRDGDDVRVFRIGEGSYLGVCIDEVTDERAREIGMKRAEGAYVSCVEDNSPAEEAGIREGDVILAFGGDRIIGVRTLRRLVSETPAGRTVEIELFRDGRRTTVRAGMKERPGPEGFYFGPGSGKGYSFRIPEVEIPEIDLKLKDVMRLRGWRPRLGVGIDDLNPQLAEFLGVDPDRGGLFINRVYEETPAEKAGLKAGDVILEADGKRIENVMDLREVLDDNAGRTFPLLIMRRGSERTVEVTLEDRGDDEEYGRRLDGKERREVERALREARRSQREAMEQYREQLRELRELQREQRRALPYAVSSRSGDVEI